MKIYYETTEGPSGCAESLRQYMPHLDQAEARRVVAKTLGFRDWDDLSRSTEKRQGSATPDFCTMSAENLGASIPKMRSEFNLAMGDHPVPYLIADLVFSEVFWKGPRPERSGYAALLKQWRKSPEKARLIAQLFAARPRIVRMPPEALDALTEISARGSAGSVGVEIDSRTVYQCGFTLDFTDEPLTRHQFSAQIRRDGKCVAQVEGYCFTQPRPDVNPPGYDLLESSSDDGEGVVAMLLEAARNGESFGDWDHGAVVSLERIRFVTEQDWHELLNHLLQQIGEETGEGIAFLLLDTSPFDIDAELEGPHDGPKLDDHLVGQDIALGEALADIERNRLQLERVMGAWTDSHEWTEDNCPPVLLFAPGGLVATTQVDGVIHSVAQNFLAAIDATPAALH